jgi:asparagine synthase (glutamine-hydrolysing)
VVVSTALPTSHARDDQMNDKQTTHLCLGSPRFTNPALKALAEAGDSEAAWRAAFAVGSPAAALAGVSGDFAVALRGPSGRTLLAVDRFAAQTLCYRIVDGALRFAERADALADASTEIDPQAIFDYLYFHVIPAPRTIFQGIHRLPAGHCAVFEHGRLSVAPSFEPLKAEFLRLVEQSVAAELDGSKAACFLSGGTDSSTVAGMITRLNGGSADCYSIGFEAEGYDEMAFARLAAKHFGVRHHEYYVTPADLVDSIGAVAASHDQPFGNSSALPAYYCAKVAKADGVTKLLAGDGGDELFGGNSRYAKQRIFGWYDVVPKPLRSGLLEPVLATDLAGRIPLVKKGASYVEQARVPMPDRLQMYNLLRRLGMADVLTPGFLARVDTEDPGRQQREVWAQARTDREINRMLAFDWRYTLAEGDLPKVRGSTQLAGVGVGFPLLDQSLLDFSLRLPAEYKLKGLKLRWFFKEALRGFLPDEIITKRKQGFGLPFGVWTTRHAPLAQLATDAVRSLSTRGIVRPAFIDRLINELLPAHPGYYGEMMWILTILEQWLQQHKPDYRLDTAG